MAKQAIMYFTCSKGGREFEGEFTTLERAEADLWKNDYYLGVIVEEEVEQCHFDDIRSGEEGSDAECADWHELTNLEEYRYFLKGMNAA